MMTYEEKSHTMEDDMETPAKVVKPAAKPAPKPKAQIPARAVLEKLVGKKVRYVGRNAKFRGQMVELRAVRATKDAPGGYDVRLALGDSAQYCSVTSVKVMPQSAKGGAR